jgi:hypothetical protein
MCERLCEEICGSLCASWFEVEEEWETSSAFLSVYMEGGLSE